MVGYILYKISKKELSYGMGLAMSIYNPTAMELVIYFCIFAIGVIVGRVLMAVQVGVMKSVSNSAPSSSIRADYDLQKKAV